MKKYNLCLVLLFSMIFALISFEETEASAAGSNRKKPQNGIPVLYIDIDESQGTIDAMNSSPDHSVECHGTVSIKVPNGYKSEYTGKKVSDIENLKLDYIRGRGTSTWIIPKKKPYKIKFDESVDLFGMGKNKHWVLLANAMDGTFLRNKITYWLGDSMGMEYVMKSVPVEVVMNGNYRGLYYLCEHVRVGDNRIEIDELKEEDVDKDKISGGYLIALNQYNYEETDDMFKTARDIRFHFDTPDFLEYKNTAQREYICDYIQKTENALFGEGFCDESGTSYKEYMDLESAADYYLIQEFTRNQDAYSTTSTYLYKKRGGKLYWGPIWDFDVSTYGDSTQEHLEEYSDVEGFGPSMAWFERMKKDDEFIAILKERWGVMNQKLVELTASGGQLDKYYNQIKKAEARDANKWGFSGGTGSYQSEIEYLREWIDNRRAWITNNLDSINALYASYENMWIDGQWYGSHGSIDYSPQGEWKSNDAGWWYEDSSGWYPNNTWEQIDFTWYYFDENGYMAEDEWRDGYYLSKKGCMNYSGKAEWKKTGKGWRYEDKSGWYAKNSWLKIDGIWYQFDKDGYLK